MAKHNDLLERVTAALKKREDLKAISAATGVSLRTMKRLQAGENERSPLYSNVKAVAQHLFR